MTALVPGMRTESAPSFRSVLSVALSVAAARPSLWLLGGLGFAARGGILLLALPVMTIPSPVVLSILFRDQLGTADLAEGSDTLLLVAVGIISACLVGALFLAAYADVAAFERVAGDVGTTDLRDGVTPRQLAPGERLDLAITLATVQGAALIPAGVLAVFVAERINGAIISELTFPSSFASPLAVRVVMAAVEPLLALALALVVADLVYALASRTVLIRELGLDRSARPLPSPTRAALHGAARLLRMPFRTMGTATLCWITTAFVVVPVIWATSVAWDGVRRLFLSPGDLPEPGAISATVIATLILGAVWVAGSISAGFASAVRTCLWSVDALR